MMFYTFQYFIDEQSYTFQYKNPNKKTLFNIPMALRQFS